MSAALSGRQRLERALAIVPWIASQGGTAPIDEVCRRFDLDTEQLQTCLDTVSMVGVYPYTPDALLEVFMEPGYVYVNLPEYFTRPLRLTPSQTFGLIAAGRALLSLPGNDPEGPLARAIAKVSAAAGGDAPIDVDIAAAPAGIFDVLQEAAAAGRTVEIDHYSYNRDVWSTRAVDPWRVQAIDGRWYLEGYCHSANGTRVFRLDRIRGLRLLDAHFEIPGSLDPLEVFDAGAALPEVTLDLMASAAWVATQYPVRSRTELGGGRIRVTLAVSALPWLERLLLRLGDDAIVVAADEAVRGARASGARRVLERYLK